MRDEHLHSPLVNRFTLTVAESQPGSLPLQPILTQMVREDRFYQMAGAEDVAMRVGDRLLGQCTINVLPGTVLISNSGLGVVALDTLPFNADLLFKNTNDAVIICSMNGDIRFRKSLHDLYGQRANQFRLILDDTRLLWLKAHGSTRRVAKS